MRRLIAAPVYAYSQEWAERVCGTWYRLLHLYQGLSDWEVVLLDSASPVDWQQCTWLPVGSQVVGPDYRDKLVPGPAVNILRLPDNVGHLFYGGQDGWGRAMCAGLRLACLRGYEVVAFVESDCFLRGAGLLSSMADYMVRYRVPVVAPTFDQQWIETNLMLVNCQYAAETDLAGRYAWEQAVEWPDVRGYPERFYVEAHLTRLVQADWLRWQLPGGRIMASRLQTELPHLPSWYWVTFHGPYTLPLLPYVESVWGLSG